MATLSQLVRRKTGADDSDVSSLEIADSLARCSHYESELVIEWMRVVESGVMVYKRGRVQGWGWWEPTTQATATANGITVVQSSGSAVTGNWTLSSDGTIVFATNQTSAASSITVSGLTYDVNAVCVEVVEQLLALTVRDYDVKLGDQTFNRSQATPRLEALLARFKREQLAAPLGEGGLFLERSDEIRSPRRVQRRSDWR